MAVSMTWLQAQVTKADWDKINQRRQKLNLKWSSLLLPATVAYLDQLEAGQPHKTPKQAPATPRSKKGTKKAVAEVKAEDTGGKHGDANGASQIE